MDIARVATDADAEGVGKILAAGFAADPVLTWVFREPDREAKLGRFFGFLAREALVPLGATYVLPGACAAWTPPDPSPWPAERGERFASALAEVCTADDLERLGILDAVTKEHHPVESHWFLGVVATVPEARGRGLGTALLGQGLSVVDAAGLPAYLESTNPRNVPLYERHGFVVVRPIELPDGPTLSAMWREARRG